MREALGIDIGGVIISKSAAGSDTSFSTESFLETPQVPTAFDVIRRLNERFGERVFLVSKCGPRVQAKTRRWLRHHRFFDQTGVKPGHVYFCLDRNEKATICQRLKITHFIDDRLDVVASLKNINCFLFDPDGRASIRSSSAIRAVRSWDEIGQVLLGRPIR